MVPRLRLAERAAFLQKLGFGVFDACIWQAPSTAKPTFSRQLTTVCFAGPSDTVTSVAFASRTRYPGIGKWNYEPPLEKMSDEDFERHALAILKRELGLDGLARFLRLYRSGSGDYTRDMPFRRTGPAACARYPAALSAARRSRRSGRALWTKDGVIVEDHSLRVSGG